MAYSLQALSDRLEIDDLLTTYSHAIDFGNWDELDEVFTEDCVIDYTVFGGIRGNLSEVKEFLKASLPMFSAYYHMVSTSKITIDGDVAHGKTICYNPMVFTQGLEQPHVMTCGLWYVDTFVRTPKGWRISERVEEKSHFLNPLQPPT
jgi:hypothetical protein